MRFSTIAITLFGAAASASANSLLPRQDSLPACAVTCTTSANLGGCVVTDTKCLCTNTTFVSTTTACVEAACTGADLTAALQYSVALCLKVGVTLSAAPTGSADSSATSAPATATQTKPATTGSASAAASTSSKAAASSHGANAVLGLAAAGIVALAL